MNSSTKDMSMKNIHGKLLLFLLLIVVELSAKESPFCSYKISSSKESAVVHEAVNISFVTRQKIHNEVMFFDFKPLPSDAYEIISIKEKRSEFNYHDAKKEFEFLVIPKRAGVIKVAFDFRIRRASDDAVAQAYRGSRDNVKSIPTIKVHIDTPTVLINVKKLSKSVDAVGDFTFELKMDKTTHVNSYDRLNLVYTLKGTGFLDKDFEPIKEIDGVSIFRGTKIKTPRATQDGYIYQKEWSYALVADKNYTIPTVTLKTYNYKDKEFVNRVTKARKIEVTKLKIADLVDDEDIPNSSINFEKYIKYLYNLLIFIAGFLFAILLQYFKRKSSPKTVCCQEIHNTKTAKELLLKTTLYIDKVDLKEEIKALEELVYKKSVQNNFITLKKQILAKLKHSKRVQSN